MGEVTPVVENLNADFTDISHNPKILKVARKTQAFLVFFVYFLW